MSSRFSRTVAGWAWYDRTTGLVTCLLVSVMDSLGPLVAAVATSSGRSSASRGRPTGCRARRGSPRRSRRGVAGTPIVDADSSVSLELGVDQGGHRLVGGSPLGVAAPEDGVGDACRGFGRRRADPRAEGRRVVRGVPVVGRGDHHGRAAHRQVAHVLVERAHGHVEAALGPSWATRVAMDSAVPRFEPNRTDSLVPWCGTSRAGEADGPGHRLGLLPQGLDPRPSAGCARPAAGAPGCGSRRA